MTREEFEQLKKGHDEEEKQLLDKEFFALKEQHPEAAFFSHYDIEQREEEQQYEHDLMFNRWGAPH